MAFEIPADPRHGGGSQPSEFRTRRLVHADLQQFVQLGLPTCAFMHGRPDVSEDKMRRNFTGFVREHAFSEESEIFVAEDSDGMHAGQLWLHTTRNRFNGRRELWIWDITVRANVRGKGLGKQLLELAKKRAHDQDVEELWLLVSSINHAARHLYRLLGFCDLGQLMCLPVVGAIRNEAVIKIGATILRSLASNDAEGLQRLWQASGLSYRPDGRDSLNRLHDWLSSPESPGWCASNGHELIASAMVGFDGRKGWIERLAVRPEHRRAGLAKAVVTACVNSLKTRGALVIGALIEEGNHPSRMLFESCGFIDHENIRYYSYRENRNH